MLSAFRMVPVASGRGLCDIDRILFRVTKSRVRKRGSPDTAKIYRLESKSKNPSYRYIFVQQGLLNFLTRDLVSSYRYHTIRVRRTHTKC